VYDAPVRAVWEAWTDPEKVAKWWGPRGFTLTTHARDLRVGGTWRYTMHGPDGTDYPNVTTYHVVERYQKLVYDHGATDETPPLFRVTVTFTEANGKTTMDMTFALATPEAAEQTAKFIKRAGGNATWDRLAEHLEETATGKAIFVVNRTFEAPIARVFAMWTRPELLEKWLPPTGATMRFLRAEIAAGKSTHFVITGDHGVMYVRAEYLAIEAPGRVVYVQQFVDAHERPAPAPGADCWPPRLLTTVSLTEEAPDRTRVTVTTEAYGEATRAELEAFVLERSGMTLGWTGSFDALDTLLESGDPA
jgi:uncharacterized protein YndB with AHSA1/START domain